MELHNALKNVIQTEGQDIIKEIRLVNILDDFNAYQDIQASKYILRAIIAEGYANKLLVLGGWDNRAEILSQKFSTMTGFIPESVFKIFQSIAFGLGWVSSINKGQSGKGQNQQKKFQSNVSQQPRLTAQSGWRSDMTDDEKEEYLFSLLDYDNSKECQFHVKLENLSFEVNEDEEIEITCEFQRTGKIPGTGFACLHYALYDLRGRMKYTSSIGYIDNKDPQIKPIWDKWYKLLAPQISKIRLYWDD